MKTEKGVMLVVYKKPRRSPRYLVLKRKKNWEGWETPKGHLEDDEYRETVRIELEEETGIEEDRIEEIEEMGQEVSWEYEREGEKREKQYKVFLVKVADDADVDVSGNPHDEHEKGFFFRYDDAHTLLTYDNNREVLEKADEQLN